MSILWRLVGKDLKHDFRHPLGILIYIIIPVLTALLMSMVFAPGSDIRDNITLHIALLDEDEDFIAGMLRSFSNQGDAARNLQIHPVDTREEGLRLLEKRKVSAFLVLPQNLTSDLLNDKPVTLDLYRNPAESILPGIIEQGLQVLSVGISEALSLLRPEVKSVRDMFDGDAMPSPLEVAGVAANSIERLQTVEPYLFPPLVQFRTVAISEFTPDSFESTPSSQSEEESDQ